MLWPREISGANYSLRSVHLGDEFDILEMRLDTEISRFLNPTTESFHRVWIREQIDKENDYYFAIQSLSDDHVAGYIGLYDIHDSMGEWGRWVVPNNPAAAIESLRLILDFGFSLGLREIYCRTDSSNLRVLRLHNSLPYSKSSIEEMPNDQKFTRHTLLACDWHNFRNHLDKFMKFKAI